MKIAIVNKFFFINGGQETVALEQMRLLEEIGFNVAFYSMHHPRNPENYYWAKYFADHVDFSMRNNNLGFIQKIEMASQFIYNPKVGKRFGAFLDEFQPDIVHCHGIAHQITFSILQETQKRKIPVVQTLHDYQLICPNYTLLKGGSEVCIKGCHSGNYLPSVVNCCVKQSRSASILSALEMFFSRQILNYTQKVDLFLSPSLFLAQKVIDAGIDPARVYHLPNFLADLDKIIPQKEHDGSFLYIGRLSYEKGLETLLKAFRKVPDGKLRIAGDGALLKTLKAYCEDNDMDNVEFLGHVDRPLLEVLTRRAAAVVLPSEWYENQPMSIIEAFAYGKPVIVSKMGGMTEMVKDGHNGFLFDSGDVSALADIISSITSHPEQIVPLGLNARADALANYSGTKHLDALLKIYRQLSPNSSVLSSIEDQIPA